MTLWFWLLWGAGALQAYIAVNSREVGPTPEDESPIASFVIKSLMVLLWPLVSVAAFMGHIMRGK